MLLADAQLVAEGWIAPIIAGILTLGTAFIAYLTTRDKLRFDLRMGKLEDTVERLTAELARKDDEHADCERRHDRLFDQVRELQKAVLGRPSQTGGTP